jgi:hypothetical protein
MLIKCYREKLVVKTWANRRNWYVSEEALQYLKLRKINEKEAAQIYELVGGRVIHLKSSADDIEANNTFEGMCTAYYAENRVSFSPPLQICARRCSPTPKDNSRLLKFFLDAITTRTER